jgi:hypothetical protein
MDLGKQFSGVTHTTPKQILATHGLGDYPDTDKEEAMRSSLESASKRPTGLDVFSPNPGFDGGLLAQMKKKGFDSSKPIVLNHADPSNPLVHEGHHRLAVALHLFPNKPVPVKIVGQDYLDMQARTQKRTAYNTNRAYQKQQRLYEKAKETQVPRANAFDGTCEHCGEALNPGEGVFIRVYGNPRKRYEKYHETHLPNEVR